MRKKIIEAIFRIASDEFETISDVIELAMMTDEDLLDVLVGMIDYLKNELDDLNS